MTATFPTRRVLELACSAQRTNKDYLKDIQSVYDNEGKFLFVKHSNKSLIRWALGIDRASGMSPEFAPQDIFIEDCDKEQAEEIQKYFRRLMFSAIKGDNEFQTEVNQLLSAEEIPANKIGYMASLPWVWQKDITRNRVDKALKSTETGFLADEGAWVADKDAEILRCDRSKNFDAYNILAIIDNKIVSWMGSKPVKIGPAVIVKAKIKQHGKNWLTKQDETRLNYVKVAQ